jgi:hypothetical protein
MAKGIVKYMLGLAAALMATASNSNRAEMARQSTDIEFDAMIKLDPSRGNINPWPSKMKNQRQKRRDARRAGRKVK